MDKSQMLYYVKLILFHWERSLEKNDYSNCILEKTEFGFCHFINHKLKLDLFDSTNLTNELKKDKKKFIIKKRPHYWYSIEYNSDKPLSVLLQPRIDHLKRTFSRLEKEIYKESYKPQYLKK